MRLSSQLLLTFLFNAFWQIALIAAFSSLGSWLLRNSFARYRHWVWATALCLAFLVPAFTTSRTLIDNITQPNTPVTFERQSLPLFVNEAVPPLPETETSALASTFKINQSLGLTILGIYFAFLLYSICKLIQAWQTTRTIRRRATEIEPNDSVAEVIHRCELEFGTRAGSVKVFRSDTLPVPVTTGLFNPVIILPESLLREGNVELLTSAIGHEFVHVARRDYLLNLIYELLLVPVSFHPAAALLRRRVRETRELCCDELVAERILNAEVYARSLVRLAGPATPLRRLSVTTTVGIADADILEARIMSLLKKPNLHTRWKKSLLIVVSLLLLVPCAAAVALAMRFDVETQEPQEKALTQQDKEKIETMQRRKEADTTWRIERDPQVREEMERKERVEMEMREVWQAALVRLAKVNMDQAIQIATSQQSGKVLLCSLEASHWEAPGKLANDGFVFYHVMIANEGEAGATHIWVNAIDGTIIKTEKELPRKQREP
ncbi:MAG TPA: M56 family metallopeptidase [Pyrinomonadaceae bacterium]|jgi:beta-lactamase regulating signal transducer with metallopeptidase domain